MVTLLIFGWVRVAFSAMTGQDASLVGRGTELSLLRELVAPPPESRVMLLLGDPGVGKTILLAETAREARSAGMRVLAPAGRESEQDQRRATAAGVAVRVVDAVGRADQLVRKA